MSELSLEQKILIEEWKKNVDLYIDADKRVFARITMFLAIQGALLALFNHLKDDPLMQFFIIAFGIFLIFMTLGMMIRGHKYIELRFTQAMLIEAKLGVMTTFSREWAIFQWLREIELRDKKKRWWRKLREKIEKVLGSLPTKRLPLALKENISRDKEMDIKSRELIEEIWKRLGSYPTERFELPFLAKIGHLRAQKYIFYALLIGWVILLLSRVE